MASVPRFVKCGRKILALARNYREHAAELNNTLPKEPLVFLKPTSSYILEGQNIEMPPNCTELHYEVELGVVIGKSGKNISPDAAMEYVEGYVLALDMTARAKQKELASKGRPWSIAKGFDTSCPVSDIIEGNNIPDPMNARLWLKVNDQIKQEGNTKDMVFDIKTLISYLSQHFTLEANDVILTGTPSGVGPVKAGDVIDCGLNDNVSMKFTVK